MIFFKIKNNVIERNVNIQEMTGILTILDKEFNLKTIDDVTNNKCILLIHDLKHLSFIKERDYLLSTKTKDNYTVAVITSSNSYLKVNHGDKFNSFIRINNAGEIKSSSLEIDDFDLQVSNKVPKELIEWMGQGDRGLSSDFMASTLYPDAFNRESLEANTPADIYDFERCYLLLKSLHKYKIDRLKNISKEWDYLVDIWSYLEFLFNTNQKDKITGLLLQK